MSRWDKQTCTRTGLFPLMKTCICLCGKPSNLVSSNDSVWHLVKCQLSDLLTNYYITDLMLDSEHCALFKEEVAVLHPFLNPVPESLFLLLFTSCPDSEWIIALHLHFLVHCIFIITVIPRLCKLTLARGCGKQRKTGMETGKKGDNISSNNLN